MKSSDALAEALESLSRGDTLGAFRAAFGGLEMRYSSAAVDRGWRGDLSRGDGFGDLLRWMRTNKVISTQDFEVAEHIGHARNVTLHRLGFEPSPAQAKRTIEQIRQLCARFSRIVSDAMATPVRTAFADQTVGEFIPDMVRSGISQIPVITATEMIGTLRDRRLLQALHDGGGIVDPTTLVAEFMDNKPLPSISAVALLEDALRLMQETGETALVILTRRLPTGIITAWDLMMKSGT